MDKNITLVIMAAGMGSRFGGPKQITPVDENGHIIIDYSLYDAYKAGFRKIVFVIKKETEADFKNAIGNRAEQYFDVRYVFQKLENIPRGFEVPEGRVKPWGTAHAVLSAKDDIDAPFAVINADDYYGEHAFKLIYDFLSRDGKENGYAMVGYRLKNTVTENGYVSRGICEISNGNLISVTERTHIEKRGENAAFTEDGVNYTDIDGKTVVSMNLWGFKKGFLAKLEEGFSDFLSGKAKEDPLKAEYYLPGAVGAGLERKECSVRVLESEDVWYGMTYAEDLAGVRAALAKMTADGIYPKALWQTPSAIYKFKTDGAPVSVEPYGCGHINRTYLAVTNTGKRYILQRISDAFDVNVLMDNISAVTEFTKAHSDDERSSMSLVYTVDGKSFYTNEDGNYRVYDFVEGTVCLQAPQSEDDFRECAVGFGAFEKMLSDFPAEKLGEPIKNFHNTPDRYRLFREALEKDCRGRAKDVMPEIKFALEHEEMASVLQKMRESGELPVRVTHNDTKINNVLLDEKTRKAVCVIDLDTVMPGLSLYDFGDSIRFGAATAAEDEKDLSKMTIDLKLYRIFADAFIKSCDLTAKEKEMLPYGAIIMTLECGLRFLTDYLNGDIYFATSREDQNLDRCRTQFKLVDEMEKHLEEMQMTDN